MIVYKFYSSDNADYFFDIALKERLFCAELKKLNDPMEGFFSANDAWLYPRLERVINSHRVCCLSAGWKSHLMWAHYGKGFDGIAIKIQLPNNHADIRAMNYRKNYRHFVENCLRETSIIDTTAREILWSKYKEWSYESEVRILSKTEYFKDKRMKIHGVLAGPNTSLELADKLLSFCSKNRLESKKVLIGNNELVLNELKRDELIPIQD